MAENLAEKRLRVALLGGTFNPVHIAHLRVALELSEMLQTDRFLLMPTTTPPHKSEKGVLPFDLRCELLEAAVRDLAPLELSRLEASRKGPSFTWDTLALAGQAMPGAEIFFVLGCEDFEKLSQWRHGLDLPQRAHLAVIPRGECGERVFLSRCMAFWPEIRPTAPVDGALMTLDTGSGLVSYFDVPLLPVSATRLREHWLAGKSIRLLTPDPVLELLEAGRAEISAIWAEPTHDAQPDG